MQKSDLTIYLNNSIREIVADVLKHTFINLKEIRFLSRYRKSSIKSSKVRLEMEAKGKHIPAFLICSITDSCNLFCKGCYARENGICFERQEKPLHSTISERAKTKNKCTTILSTSKWRDIFRQASELGIAFCLIAGGEPLLRMDVLDEAKYFKSIIFPIFTNGTMIDDKALKLFSDFRNLIPIISMEGLKELTDSRRGDGAFRVITEKMHDLKKHGILYGVSITVSKENLQEVTSADFIGNLKNQGCRLVFYIEYVPIDESTRGVALDDVDRKYLEDRQLALKIVYTSILFLSFPGDEKFMGGCLAAGRGFFHIDPYGEAQPCPFSPYSDSNLRDNSLVEVLDSKLFGILQEKNLVGGEHSGGCTLFEHKDEVETIVTSLNE